MARSLIALAAVVSFIAMSMLALTLRKYEKARHLAALVAKASVVVAPRRAPPKFKPTPRAPLTLASFIPPNFPYFSPAAATGYVGDNQQVHVFEGRRPALDDSVILALSKPAPHFGGPWPKSLSEVPMTPELRKRIDEKEPDQPMVGDDYVNQRLGFRAVMRECLEEAGVHGPGSVIIQLIYYLSTVNHRGKSADLVPEASSLPEEEDERFYNCAIYAHLGRKVTFRDSYAINGFVIYETIDVPVTNDSYYRSLFGLEAK